MSEQIAVRLPERLLEALDGLVTNGRYRSRADAVRGAVERLVDSERRGAIGSAIAGGYRRQPQTDDEVAAAEAAALRSIREEPW